MINKTKLESLSEEAQDVIEGMIDYCLRNHICMGMDEGFKSENVKHSFRLEIEELIK